MSGFRTAFLFAVVLMQLGTVDAGAQKEPVDMHLEAFGLKHVRLLDGPCRTAQEANRRYLKMLDSDRLLHDFRLNAGLPAPGEPLGGWEAPNCEVRGHFVGHYLSACALMYASAGDEDLKAKADAMVAELARCQEALGGGYLSAYPATFFDRLESMEKPPWAPYYTIHKVMAGMFDMYRLCGNEQALDVLKGMAACFNARFDKLSVWRRDKILEVEFGGMSEVLHNLYSVTGDESHLRLAHLFDQAAFLGPLALEHDNLSRIHGNTQIPKICGAARRYEITGDERCRTIVRCFWDRVVRTRTYATGGTTVAEFWTDPNKLAHSLAENNQECCTSHNMLKVTRYLIRWTGEAAYGDYYQRVYFNSILGTQNPETGMLLYFVPLASGWKKSFGTPYDSFWCCYGTGIESFAKLGDSIYFHDDDGLYVNLFVASDLNWKDKGLRLEQTTAFPEQEGTSFTFHVEEPVSIALNVLVPWWATEGWEVKVNGEPAPVQTRPRTYLTIRRQWQDGDQVEVHMPMRLYAHTMPDDEELRAIMYGPVVLAGLTEVSRYFVADADNMGSWIKLVEGKPLTFRTVGMQPDMTFVPLNKVIDERYGVYWVITREGSERHKSILAEEERLRMREARVVDRVTPGDEKSEAAHDLHGEAMASGHFRGKHWRHAADAWWSWDMKVLPDKQMTLICTYWGSDVGSRTFDVLVDGRRVATQTLNRNKPNEFFEVEYPIPEELTKGKTGVTVKFQAHKGNVAGGVFECAILRPE